MEEKEKGVVGSFCQFHTHVTARVSEPQSLYASFCSDC